MRIESFDPRARVTFYVCLTTAVLVVNDLRVLIGLALLGVGTLIFARVPWERMKHIWLGAAVFIALITALNLLFRSPIEAAQQALRAVAMAAASLAIVLTFDPADLGITFRRMGFPDRFAFALDLTARFVPTLIRDFQITIDAQKARGYELESRDRSLKSILTVGRRFVPLIVPVVVRAVLDAEDRANAMDLRAFGTGPRTWLQTLRLRARDYALVVASFALLAGGIAARLLLG
ncbi:MAG: energy-coupling factor transporter transmembrane component T family protein [Candidatus Brachytrichaceae bacterium NZ_4S206]|jgi:energy-coupling factor transport system permease protein